MPFTAKLGCLIVKATLNQKRRLPPTLLSFLYGEESQISVCSPICVWVSTIFFSATWRLLRLLGKPCTATWTNLNSVHTSKCYSGIPQESTMRYRKHLLEVGEQEGIIIAFLALNNYLLMCVSMYLYPTLNKKQENRLILREINNS